MVEQNRNSSKDESVRQESSSLIAENRVGEKKVAGFSLFGRSLEMIPTQEEVERAEQGMKWKW
jgi:hypothetical protein